jgi:hypothetical protein
VTDVRARSLRTTLPYLLLIPICAVAFWLMHGLGTELSAPPPGPAAARFGAPVTGTPTLDSFIHLLLALAVILVAARVVGRCSSGCVSRR